MNQDKIKEKLEKIKSDIENAFEKKLIDFDEIEKELTSIIDTLQNPGRKTLVKAKSALNIENYV